jgi:Flp pilus assembly pilin Flp
MSGPDDCGVGGYFWLYATGARNCSYSTEVRKEEPVSSLLRRLWSDEQGQDIAEYAVMLAVILVIVVGTIRLIGTNSNTIFSQVGSAIQ